MKSLMNLIPLAALLVVAPMAMTAHGDDGETGTWTGEVLDLACYVAQEAMGEGHAGCAKSCVKNGQPMGLMAEDGTVVLLAAHHKDGAPYEALKDLAGQQAVVSGQIAERAGMKVVTVTESKPAG